MLTRTELFKGKLIALRVLSVKFSTRRKINKLELQQIVGHMSSAARAINGALTFTRIFVDTLTLLKKPHHQFRITQTLAREVAWRTNTAPCLTGYALRILDSNEEVCAFKLTLL